jgi:predicted ABC-type sugar transport system permease subunit
VMAVMILLAVLFVFVMTAMPASYGGVIAARAQVRAGNGPGGPTPPPER